jgi:alanine racemase
MADATPGDDRPVLTIDLAAIVANWLKLAELAAPALAAPAVKADAYGLGMAEVAPALAVAGAKDFFVATPEEGAALRRLLPAATIYVLNGLPTGGAASLLAHRLIPCLKCMADIEGWTGAQAPAALLIDSGLNRLGLTREEVTALAAAPERLAKIDLALVMSHLACSEEADNPMNRHQLDDFQGDVRRLGLAGKPLSIAASSGIFLGPDFHLTLVRPGAALYGIAPLNNQPNPMRQVIRLQAKILQVRRVDRGMTVGYGATCRVAAPGFLAIAGMGYGDGLMRSLANRGCAVLGDRRLPVMGRVSMDLITLDLGTTAPDGAVPGAMVELIGPSHGVEELAQEAGTNGYEVLTALRGRTRRVYLPAEPRP